MTERFLAAPARDGLSFLTLADLSVNDFFKAQQFAAFSQWTDFDDFQLERDSLSLGYESAGVSAPRQLVSFDAFEGWSRLTGAPIDIDALDEFAAHWRYRESRPTAPVRGRFGVPGRPETNAVETGAAQSVVIRQTVYARWRDAFAAHAPFLPPDLDAYATQIVACCLSPSLRARRLALKFV